MTNAYNNTAPLPDGWRWVKLGDVCEFLDSRRIPVNDSTRMKRIAGKKESDLFPYYGANGQVGWIDDYIFDEPTILLAEDGGNFGSFDRPIAYAVSGRYWVNNHAHVLRPRPVIDFDYCLHSLRIRPDIVDLVSGSTRAKLNQEIAAKVPIPLPPLSEQKRIAAILNEQLAAVEQARAATEAQLEAAKSLPAAYLREVFNSPEAERWEKRKLAKHIKKIGSGITPRGGQSSYLRQGIPLIRSQNVLMNGFTRAGLALISNEQDEEMEASRVAEGDVLLNITGASIGRVCVVPSALCPANVNQHVSIIRHDGSYNSKFLAYFISNPDFQKSIMDMQAGATRQALTKALIEGFEIPFPSLEVQKEISNSLDAKNSVRDELLSKLKMEEDAIAKLPAALLRKAFRGEL